MDVLSRADEILLLAILRLKNNAYGVSIVKEVKQRTGKKLMLGGLWVSLDILAKKGLITKKMGDPTPQRGGRSKIFYFWFSTDALDPLITTSRLITGLSTPRTFPSSGINIFPTSK